MIVTTNAPRTRGMGDMGLFFLFAAFAGLGVAASTAGVAIANAVGITLSMGFVAGAIGASTVLTALGSAVQAVIAPIKEIMGGIEADLKAAGKELKTSDPDKDPEKRDKHAENVYFLFNTALREGLPGIHGQLAPALQITGSGDAITYVRDAARAVASGMASVGWAAASAIFLARVEAELIPWVTKRVEEQRRQDEHEVARLKSARPKTAEEIFADAARNGEGWTFGGHTGLTSAPTFTLDNIFAQIEVRENAPPDVSHLDAFNQGWVIDQWKAKLLQQKTRDAANTAAYVKPSSAAFDFAPRKMADGGSSPVLVVGALAAAGGAAWWWFKGRKR